MSIENLEFFNTNSLRNYPIKEDASRTSSDSAVTIPNSLIVDFVMVTPEAKAEETIYVSKLSLFGNLLILEMKDSSGDQVTLVTVDMDTHVKYQGYFLNGTGKYISAQGKIVIGDLTEISAFPNGVYNFEYAATVFEVCCVRPDIRGINGVILVNGTVESDPIYGDIQFVAGTNFKLEEPTAGTIRLNAISGEGLSVDDPCADAIALPPPIRTINGLSPDVNGNFGVQGTTCIGVATQTGLISLADQCSSACCSCQEVEWITDRLTILVQQNVDLQEKFGELVTRLEEFEADVLATTT